MLGVRGEPGWELYLSVDKENDYVVAKDEHDAFSLTDEDALSRATLPSILSKLAAKRVLVCGFVTNNCVRSTGKLLSLLHERSFSSSAAALAAAQQQYDVTVLSDATGAAQYNEKQHTAILECELPDAGVKVRCWRDAMADEAALQDK